jgi:hypothetical protein
MRRLDATLWRAAAFQLAGVAATIGIALLTVGFVEPDWAHSAGTTARAFREIVAANPVVVVNDTDSTHKRHVRDSAQQSGSHAHLPKDSLAARRAAAAHARRHGADSIKAHNAPPESATPP